MAGVILRTPAGTVRHLGGVWSGPAVLVAAIAQYPQRPVRLFPVGPTLPVDRGDDRWVFLHAYWALRNRGVVVEVIAAPTLDAPPIPPGCVA